MSRASMYLVVSSTGEAPKWHARYKSALTDVRRRLGLRNLHPMNGRTTREALHPAERTFVYNGRRWHTVQIEEYKPTNRDTSATVYCVGR